MTDENQDSPNLPVALLVALGLGAGALLGLALARRASLQNHMEIRESVEELKERTQKVLNELSGNVADLLDQTRSTLQETIGPGAEEA